MLAIGMLRDKPGVHAFELPKPEITSPGEVLIRMKEVGLDGTDYNIVRYNLQDIAEGKDRIVLGHEGVGIVEAVGSEAKAVAPGDTVVLTVRRSCGQCAPCLHNQSDMCMTGLFTERGIHKLDGLLTQFVIDREEYIVKVPPQVKGLAVLTEPLSIVEKGIHELRVIQSRIPWYCPHDNHGWLDVDWGGCKVVLVVGAGSLGLLATALIRLADAYTYVADVLPKDHIKARLVKKLGAHYIDARGKTPQEIVDFCCAPTGQLDIIFEASGAAETALRLTRMTSRNGIYIMTGIPRGDMNIEINAAQMVSHLVRTNQVLLGSVNSNHRHFALALDDIGEVNRRFHGMLGQIITHRVPLRQSQQAFATPHDQHIKTVVEIEPWDS